MAAVARAVATELHDALLTSDRASLAVPGGTTPAPMLERLAQAEIDWTRIDVTLSDERWVSEDHDRSNTRLIRRHLLSGMAAAATFLPLRADTPEPEDALEALGAGLMPHLPLSVLVLGMGEDMHTASLFPGAEGLAAGLSPDAAPLVALRGGGAPEPRISLSAPVLQSAGIVHLLITGSAKRAALDRARGQAPEAAPVALILQRAHIHWTE